MRPGRFGLSTLAAMVVGALVAGVGASAQAAASAPAVKPPEITKDQRDAGMKAAPALVQAAGVPCTLADARKIGATPPDPKTKQVSTYYEVACKGAMGFVIVDHGAGQTPSWAACPDQAKVDPASGKPNGAACFLPANIDDKAQIAPFVAKGGVPCDVANARGIGHSAKSAYFEVACTNGRGYVMTTSSPPDPSQKVQMISCLAFDATSPVACKLTNTDSQLAVIDQLAAKTGKNCTVKQKRYVLTTEDESNYYEIACADGKGFMLQEKADGSLGELVDCAVADNIGGGCTFTNGRAAQTEEAALYSKLAHNAGYNCDVSKYSPFDVNVPGHEVVELACSNRPDGAVAVFPASSAGGQKAVVYDCAHSEVAGYRCGFTKADAALPTLTADLRTLNKNSCVVSAARFIARTTTNQGFIEVACSDGAPGFIIEYSSQPVAPTRATPCVQAQGIEGGCTMPQNQKKG